MEPLITFVFPVLLVVPFAVLFVLLRRYEKKRFWRWFIVYSISAVLGGFLSIFLFDLAFPLLDPIQRAYLDWAAKVLSRPGNNTILLIFLRLHMFLYGLLVWYSGVVFAVWVVWRRHISRRNKNEAAPQADAK